MLSWLADPAFLILALALLAFLLRKTAPRLSWVLVSAAGISFYLLSTPIAAGVLLDGLQWYPALSEEEASEPDAGAVVVLSAGRRRHSPEYGGETVDGLTLERIRYAARLARSTRLPLLASGGGKPPELAPMAVLMADSLEQDFGVPVEWLESGSLTTAENAALTAEVLERQGIGRIYLVTHAWHMPRAKRAFERHGLMVVPAPTGFVSRGEGRMIGDWLPQATAFASSSFAIHEWLGLLWYWLRFDVLNDKVP